MRRVLKFTTDTPTIFYTCSNSLLNILYDCPLRTQEHKKPIFVAGHSETLVAPPKNSPKWLKNAKNSRNSKKRQKYQIMPKMPKNVENVNKKPIFVAGHSKRGWDATSPPTNAAHLSCRGAWLWTPTPYDEWGWPN